MRTNQLVREEVQALMMTVDEIDEIGRLCSVEVFVSSATRGSDE